MNSNRDTQAARNYHDGTKHPGGRLMDPHHRYHPGLEPLPFKIYEGLEEIRLPLEDPPAGMPALEAIAAAPHPTDVPRLPDVDDLARILFFSAGITKKMYYQWGETYFRAAACTGALYHIELYAVCGDLPGLAAGLYHYEPHNHTLARLRSGDFRAAVSDASGEEPHISHAPLILLYTDVWWRNAVKYQAREYRHTYWDGGTILSHSLAMAAARDLPAYLVLGFADGAVNDLLGLNTAEEVCFALLPVGYTPHIPPPSHEVAPLHLTVKPISDQQITFQPILDMHQASSLPDGASAAAWRAETPSAPDPEAALIPLAPQVEFHSDPLEQVIIRRGSTRRFLPEPISLEQLAIVLRQSTQGLAADFLTPYGVSLTVPYLIVNAVEGLTPGVYVYHAARAALEPIRAGEYRVEAGRLALGQDLAADAAANIYFLADLEAVLDRLGNRGYRAAQLEAAIIAGRMYLAAYAQKFGASGLTFFDDEVTEFMSPHGAGKDVMFLLTLGKKAVRRQRP